MPGMLPLVTSSAHDDGFCPDWNLGTSGNDSKWRMREALCRPMSPKYTTQPPRFIMSSWSKHSKISVDGW